jgi:uncharacterized RDD family membrane protein YckC
MRDARPEGSPYPKADLTLRGLARAFDMALSFALASVAGPAGPAFACLYLLAADGLHHGQSLGKRVFGVRAMVLPRGAVHPQRGRPAGYRESLLRNLPFALLALFYSLPVLWLVLFLAGVPILAFESWMVWSDRLGVRIGDIFADTQVVDAKVVSRIEVTAVGAELRAVPPAGPAAAHRGARSVAA